MVAKKSKRGRKATRKTPPPLAKGGFAPEQIIDKIDLRETCNQVFNKYYLLWNYLNEIVSIFSPKFYE